MEQLVFFYQARESSLSSLVNHQVEVELHCTALHYTEMQFSSVQWSALHCTEPHETILQCSTRRPSQWADFLNWSGCIFCTTLQNTAKHRTALHCTVRHCTTRYYTVLKCIHLWTAESSEVYCRSSSSTICTKVQCPVQQSSATSAVMYSVMYIAVNRSYEQCSTQYGEVQWCAV